MPKQNRFKRGETTYTCASCKRLTRNTGDNGQCELCPQCFELAGIENAVNDDDSIIDEVRERVERLAAEIRAAGGTPHIGFLQANS